MITLTLLHPYQSIPIQSWSFSDETIVRIGRATDNNVVLHSAVVSRYHVELRRRGDNWEIINLGSNGTYIEGRRITQGNAIDGVAIQLARSGPNIKINISQDTLKPLLEDKKPVGRLPELSVTLPESLGDEDITAFPQETTQSDTLVPPNERQTATKLDMS